jgi:transcriptional regulator with XRE-family HTH domain
MKETKWQKRINKILNTPVLGKNITQAQLARACGVQSSTISGLAEGRTKTPNFDTGNAIMKVMSDFNILDE